MTGPLHTNFPWLEGYSIPGFDYSCDKCKITNESHSYYSEAYNEAYSRYYNDLHFTPEPAPAENIDSRRDMGMTDDTLGMMKENPETYQNYLDSYGIVNRYKENLKKRLGASE